MALLSIIEKFEQRSGSIEAYTLGSSTRHFSVVFDSATHDDNAALFAAGLPTIRSAHPSRPGLWLRSKQASQAADDGCKWDVVCSYDSTPKADLPWNEPTLYAWGQQATEQICDFDVSSQKPIRNSAGCEFDPGISATRYEATLTVSRNELNFTYDKPLKYVGSVNASSFYTAPAGYCMCTGIAASQQYYVNEAGYRTPYWSVQYNFAFRNKFGWQAHVLDAGYMEKSDSGDLIAIVINGREPSTPVPLKDGKRLENPESAEPAWLDFKIYPEHNFNSLGV